MKKSLIISTILCVSAMGMVSTKMVGAAYNPTSWIGKQNAIYFYEKTNPFYELTNFFHLKPNRLQPDRGHKLIIDGQQWRSTEHYFQAQKFILFPAIYNQILNADSASKAVDIAQQNLKYVRPDWHKADRWGMAPKDKAMMRALWEKFTQNPDLRDKLLETGTRTLIEDSSDDDYWGRGSNGMGRNQLGQMLMYIRYLLIKGLQPGTQNSYLPAGAARY